MWRVNAGLSADHPFASRPMAWPSLTRGIGFWNGDNDIHLRDERAPKDPATDQHPILKTFSPKSHHRHSQIYLLGNPLVWWLALLGSTVMAVVWAVKLVAAKRRYSFAWSSKA